MGELLGDGPRGPAKMKSRSLWNVGVTVFVTTKLVKFGHGMSNVTCESSIHNGQ